jgi:hypothetical protein
MGCCHKLNEKVAPQPGGMAARPVPPGTVSYARNNRTSCTLCRGALVRTQSSTAERVYFRCSLCGTVYHEDSPP